MTVRAKFTVGSVTRYADGCTGITAYPVYAGSPENEAFFNATPSGKLELHIARGKPAADLFVPGAVIYVDITPA